MTPNPEIRIINSRTGTFARISHGLLNDSTISASAKGVLCYLLGKPPHWIIRVKDITNHMRDGAHAIRSALNELRSAGYAKYEMIRGENGRMKDSRWSIASEPIFSKKPRQPKKARKPNRGNKDNHYQQRDENLKAIGFADYKDYLKSEMWSAIRRRVFDARGMNCMGCGKKSQCVHHSSYDTDVLLGEKIDALYPLCNRCHGKIELKKNGKKEYSAEVIHAKLLKMIERKDYLAKIGATEP